MVGKSQGRGEGKPQRKRGGKERVLDRGEDNPNCLTGIPKGPSKTTLRTLLDLQQILLTGDLTLIMGVKQPMFSHGLCD